MNNLNINELFFRSKRPYYWIIALGILVYFRSLFFGFTYFDDNVLIIDNLWFLKDLGNFFRAFTMEVFHVLHASAAYYRPILTISYMFDAVISGENPWLYHLTSIVIHLINSCLLYLLLKKLKLSSDLAFVFSAVFVVHPVLLQGVSWLPGRNDTLLALFLLPSFIFFLDYLEKQTVKPLLWHFIFFALALFTKESGLFFPLIIIFYGILFSGQRIIVKNLKNFLPGWILTYILWFFLRSIALATNPAPYTLSSAVSAVVKNSPAAILFIGKVFLPFNLTVLPTLEDSTLIYGFISLAMLLVAVFISKEKRWPVIVFGVVWFLAFLLPSFVRPNTSYVADFLEHRVYVPILGLFLILAELDWLKKFDLQKPKYYLPFFSLLLVLIVINFIHNGNFAGRLVFWKNAVKYTPQHPLAHKNLGAMYYLDDNLEAAEVEFKKSVELNPQEPMIHNNLGLIYLRRKDFTNAEAEFAKELELYPTYDNAHFNWGLLYYVQGQKEKAAEMWLKTVAVNPDHKEALRNLAYYYLLEVKDSAKGNYFYQEAVKRGAKF